MEFGKISYASEKYSDAMDALATGREAIRDRLVIAVNAISVLREENLPPDLLGDHQRIIREATKVSGPEGNIRATILGMDQGHAIDIAERIFRVYREVERLSRRIGGSASTLFAPTAGAPMKPQEARPVRESRSPKKRPPGLRRRRRARK